MLKKKPFIVVNFDFLKILLFLAISIIWSPVNGISEIIWSGDFETGNFNQWHGTSNRGPNLSQMPEYGRPIPYGDGSLLELVKNPIRQGNYAAKFTVKNALNGTEPDDCDFVGCDRRRTELTMHTVLSDYYDGMPYMSERWMSISVFVPSDWDSNGTGWGPVIFQVQPRNMSSLSPLFEISINSDSWRIFHRWSDVENPHISDVPWQQNMLYTSSFPAPSGGDGGNDLRGDFPNQTVSQRALGELNKGGWTDWVIYIKLDARGSQSGGTGFLKVWKRKNTDEWIHVLDIFPKIIDRNGYKFDRGIGYNSPPTIENNGGFGVKAGLYMRKEQVWNLQKNRVVFLDNIKIGNQHSTFDKMSPDGSIPTSLQTSINPPENLRIE